ncbi:MAG: hypothetical protein Q9159_002034 [Coniocarpon cinnabarinum]
MPSLVIDPTPFAEPRWLCGIPSPYYNDSHRKWQRTCRDFISKHLNDFAIDWEKAERVPDHVYPTFASARMLIPTLPAPLPVNQLKDAGIHELPGGLKVEDFDPFHGAVYGHEMARSGTGGPAGSLTVGLAYGTPPIYKFGSPQLQRRFLPDIFHGRKRICIAITEPDAGSDVANIKTPARKSSDGRRYILDGAKKWITNGIMSDYATMAVRTGPEESGAAGLSLLIVPLKGQQGVTMRRIPITGQRTSGTTYIELDNVEVPVDNLIGKEGNGMKYIMTNFNHERLSIAVGVTTSARVALSSAFAYVLKRHVFGQPLMTREVVRHRLAKCGADLEALWAWVETFHYALQHMSKEEADMQLGGLTAAAKAKAGMVLNECAQCAVLLFGGNGLTRSGQGEIAEMIYREVNNARVPGGSEDVMLDLCVRQLVKVYQSRLKELDKRGPAKL